MGKYGTQGLKAQGLYIKGKTYDEISAILGVSPQTLCNWSQEYNWPALREAYRKRPGGIQDRIGEILEGKLDAVDAESMTAADADIVCKMSKAAKDLGASEDYPEIIALAMEDFGQYVSRAHFDEEKKEVICEAIQGFMKDIEKNIY